MKSLLRFSLFLLVATISRASLLQQDLSLTGALNGLKSGATFTFASGSVVKSGITFKDAAGFDSVGIATRKLYNSDGDLKLDWDNQLIYGDWGIGGTLTIGDALEVASSVTAASGFFSQELMVPLQADMNPQRMLWLSTNTPDRLKYRGASTTYTLATLADLTSGYQPLSANLTAFSAKTAPAGTVVGTTDTQALTGKTYNGLTPAALATGFTLAGGTTSKTLTISNTLTLAGTDASTLNIGTGGTLGTAAFTAATAYAPAAGSGSIATLGTVTAGTWQATVIAGQYGGTGVANTGKTLTLGGNLTTSGAFATTLTTTAATTVTLPTTGTLATTAGTVPSIAGTTGQVLVNGAVTAVSGSAVTLTLPTALTSVNSITSVALSDLTLGTGTTGAAATIKSATNSLLLGTTTDSSNGRLQLATHTTGAGGIGFGTDTTFSRISAGTLAIGATSGPTLRLVENGVSTGQIASSAQTIFVDNLTNNPLVFRTNATTALTIANNQNATFAQNLVVSGASASTSTTTGALTVGGGIGVAGAGYFGGDLLVSKNSGTLGIVTASDPTNYNFKIAVNYSAANPWSITSGNATPFEVRDRAIAGVSGSSLNFASYYGITFNSTSVAPGSTPQMVLYGSGTLGILTTTDATTGGAGSLTTAGGIYAAKKIVAGDTINTSATGSAGAPAFSNGSSGMYFSATNGTLVLSSGGTQALTVTTSTVTSNVAFTGQAAVLSSNATGGIGYTTGAGGTVIQATSKATATTLSKVCGTITTAADALAASTTVSFVLTNTAITAADTLEISHVSGGTLGAYAINYTPAAGSVTIFIRNLTAGSLSEALLLRFAILKSVNA
jgi:hypothetical protein